MRHISKWIFLSLICVPVQDRKQKRRFVLLFILSAGLLWQEQSSPNLPNLIVSCSFWTENLGEQKLLQLISFEKKAGFGNRSWLNLFFCFPVGILYLCTRSLYCISERKAKELESNNERETPPVNIFLPLTCPALKLGCQVRGPRGLQQSRCEFRTL